MKAFIRMAILVCIVALAACSKPAPIPLTTFSPADNSFSVMVRGTPTVKVLEANQAANFKGGNSYSLQADGRLYLIAYFDYLISPPGMHSDSLVAESKFVDIVTVNLSTRKIFHQFFDKIIFNSMS